ncbi:magnesium/cobalt transporter CorA [Candidatus Micrarchaeota archaeon]|nr:magnesium/cobalt transporter CorA [Candidatus Micrarchaeota archaeon]
MSRYFKRASKKAGLSPGTAVFVGEKKTDRVEITLFNFTSDDVKELKPDSFDACFPIKDAPSITWINVDGVHDSQGIQKLGDRLGFHPMLIEDIVHTDQRPKLEDFGDHLFLVMKMLYFDREKKRVESEQVSVILGKQYVISFQEKPGDVFDPLRERLRKGKGRIRRMGADYLFYTLIDSVVDHYFVILEELGERIEQLEGELVANPSQSTLHSIHAMKTDLVFLRKGVWPLREVISGLQRNESKLIKNQTAVFLRDVYDHIIHAIDSIDSYRDLLSGMMDLYMSSISNRMNEVMKTLTVIATLFIPLTFIVGVYGMNFRFMPELDWPLAYPILWMFMIAISFVMLFYFRKQKWV